MKQNILHKDSETAFQSLAKALLVPTQSQSSVSNSSSFLSRKGPHIVASSVDHSSGKKKTFFLLLRVIFFKLIVIIICQIIISISIQPKKFRMFFPIDVFSPSLPFLSFLISFFLFVDLRCLHPKSSSSCGTPAPLAISNL